MEVRHVPPRRPRPAWIEWALLWLLIASAVFLAGLLVKLVWWHVVLEGVP